MNIIEKLQNFKRKIESPTITNDELAILIGTELYEYIIETPELKKEFNYRFQFLDNLPEDKIDDKTQILSLRLHTKQFQHFFLDCAGVRKIKGWEGYYLSSGGKLYNNTSIKKSALAVTDDLIEVMGENRGNNKPIKPKNAIDASVKKIEVGQLVYDVDGGIYFKNKLIEMRSQLETLCILFMKNHKKPLGYEIIKDELIDPTKTRQKGFITITKYVSELHKLLKKYFNKEVIFNHEKHSYIFDIEHKFKKLNKK